MPYNKPNMKMLRTPIFLLVGNCIRNTAPMGMMRRTTSNPKPTAAKGTDSIEAFRFLLENVCSIHVSPGLGVENINCVMVAAP